MVKILDDLKAKLPKLDELKSMFGQAVQNRNVLPEDLKKQMESVDRKLQEFVDLHKKLDDAAHSLKKEVMTMCQSAISLYTPKEAPKTPSKAASSTESSEPPKEEGK